MWASHQFTCGKPESPFILPPLSSQEALLLRSCRDSVLIDELSPSARPRTLFAILQDLGLYKGSRDEASRFPRTVPLLLRLCTDSNTVKYASSFLTNCAVVVVSSKNHSCRLVSSLRELSCTTRSQPDPQGQRIKTRIASRHLRQPGTPSLCARSDS